MFVSRYVKQIEYDTSQIILHNMYNGAIYLIPKDDWKTVQAAVLAGQTEGVPHVGDLASESFLVEKELEPVYVKNADFFTVTVETTSCCNLRCTYCYENDKGTRGTISTDVLDHTLRYIENVFREDQTGKHLTLGFIGGEPLLCKSLVLDFCARVKALCQQYSRTFNYHIDTNGTIPFDDLYQELDNLHVSVSLTPKEDHNVNRPAMGFDSFETILANLKKLSPKKNNDFSIRYNTNEKNIFLFRDFVSFVRQNLPICEEIEPMYTDEYMHCTFKNKLPLEDYKRWNSGEAIDILIENGFVVPYTIGGRYTPCTGMQDYSCKVYTDGKVTLCDSMLHDQAKCDIFQISDAPERLNAFYRPEKLYNPLDDPECRSCVELGRCMGKIFCRTDTGNPNLCDYEHRFDPDLLVKTAVKYYLAGRTDFMPNMF